MMGATQLAFNYNGWKHAHALGKRVVCLPSLQRDVIANVEVFSSASFDFGTALEWQNYLLEYVFEFLEAKDLKSASLVNSLWNNLAEREFQRRIAPVWITFSYDPIPRQLLYLRTSPGLKYSNSAMCLMLYCPDMIRLDQQVWLDKAPKTKSIAMTSFAEYITREIVPSGVDYCTIPCTKISTTSMSKYLETVIYHGIFIPFIPNVRAVMFYCDTKFEEISNVVNSNEKVKCILMFNRSPLGTAKHFFEAFLKGQSSETVAVGGGFLNQMKTSTKTNNHKLSDRSDLFCITFLQEAGVEANFNAYSLVLKYDYKADVDSQREDIEAELVMLKESSVLRKHGIVFQFCFFANYRRANAVLIEKHFPNYAVVGLGLEMDEIIGWNSVYKNEFDIKSEELPTFPKTKTDFLNSLHSQSIGFVVITWGKTCNTVF